MTDEPRPYTDTELNDLERNIQRYGMQSAWTSDLRRLIAEVRRLRPEIFGC